MSIFSRLFGKKPGHLGQTQDAPGAAASSLPLPPEFREDIRTARKSVKRFLRFGDASEMLNAIVGVGVVRVRRADDVRDAIVGGDTQHGARHLPGFGAVIDGGKEMAVDVYQLIPFRWGVCRR